MFGSRRRGYASFAGLTALILVGVLVWYALYQMDNAHQRHDAANARTNYAEYELECETIPSLTARLECVIDKGAASYDQQHTHQDLRAQQDVAGATIVLMVMGVVGLVASMVGIALVYENLREMRRQTLATREIGENQSKSYAWVREAMISFPSGKESEGQNIRLPGKANIAVRIMARNEGETPATDASAWATLQIFSNTGNAFAPIKLEYEGAPTKDPKVRVITKNGEEPLWLFIPDGREPKIQNAFANALDPKNWAVRYGVRSYEVQGILQYRDVFGHWYHSAFKFFGSVNEDGKFNPAFRSEDPGILFLKVKAPRVPDSDKGEN